jgi:hypothetical protein
VNYKTRSLGTTLVAVLFLLLAGVFFIFGQNTIKYIGSGSVAIVSICYFIIAWIYFQRGRKKDL